MLGVNRNIEVCTEYS